MKIKALEQVFIGKTRINELEGELSTIHTELDVERHARIQTEELLNAQKLQIEFMAVEHYKECQKHKDKLEEYIARAYIP